MWNIIKVFTVGDCRINFLIFGLVSGSLKEDDILDILLIKNRWIYFYGKNKMVFSIKRFKYY